MSTNFHGFFRLLFYIFFAKFISGTCSDTLHLSHHHRNNDLIWWKKNLKKSNWCATSMWSSKYHFPTSHYYYNNLDDKYLIKNQCFMCFKTEIHMPKNTLFVIWCLSFVDWNFQSYFLKGQKLLNRYSCNY